MTSISSTLTSKQLLFVGGGNMASAIVGGLLQQGLAAAQMRVVEPYEPQREVLLQKFGVDARGSMSADWKDCDLVVWAVKPQTFKEAALACSANTQGALHLSVAAGIRTDSMAQWLGTDRIVRAMPNTPALVGLGMTGLFARKGCTEADSELAQQVVGTTGEYVWLQQETDLDAVTALSGSGPAYVFYFLEAMRQAGTDMGLNPDTALALAIGTFKGAATLAQNSPESPEVLRERVTSKGGTTYAALTSMEASGVKAAFVKAMHAAHLRAQELGDEFGK
jgi:pyrroline-5-carboxylate reductase